MHILYPIGTFYPAQSGGPSNSVYWLARALVQQGEQITVLSTATDQPAETHLDQWLDTEAGQVRYVSTRRHTVPVSLIRQAIRALPTADVVHLTSLFYTLSLMVGMVALTKGKAVVWSPRGELSAAALAIRPGLKRFILRIIQRWADQITFHTTSAKETACVYRQFGSSVRVIELGNFYPIDPACGLPIADGSPATDEASRYLLYLGRLHPIKALDQLIKALSTSVVFRTGGWQLRLVGPDLAGYGTTLRQLVADENLTAQVSFEPPVAGIQKDHLLANAYLLALPSHSENFGNVVVEALAQGTPVLASTGTPWQILDTEGAGFWIANDTISLQTAIDTALSLPIDQYRAYRQRARTLAQQHFSIDGNIHRWVNAYQTVITLHQPTSICVE